MLDLVYYPDERLKCNCEEVEKFDSSLHKSLDQMFDTMYNARGIGLAAPQVGILKRYTVMDVSEDRSEKLEFINPKIIHKSGKEVGEEGCLSIPGYRASVSRATNVTVVAQDRKGDEFELEAEGLLAICLQHEIDHLNGVLFVDKLSRLKKQMFKKWYTKHGLDV